MLIEGTNVLISSPVHFVDVTTRRLIGERDDVADRNVTKDEVSCESVWVDLESLNLSRPVVRHGSCEFLVVLSVFSKWNTGQFV
jgi:hypothetical protein